MTDDPPAHVIDWQGNDWTPGVDDARPPTRTPASPRRPSQCPSIAPEWEDPKGVPISAILFGGRRAHQRAARDRGATTGSTACSSARSWLGDDRRRSRARSASCASTRSRCCRSAATTWATTSPTGSTIGEATDAAKLPKIFCVNWFRKDDDGQFLWPGFGENSRVLKWVFERVDGDAEAVDTPIGKLPDARRARHRRPRHRRRRPRRAARRSTSPAGARRSRRSSEHYAAFGDRLPASLTVAVDNLEAQLA